MPKVTVNEGPSAVKELMSDAAKEVIVEDVRGRKITLKKPGILAQYRLVESMGAERAANDVLRIMIMPLIYVAAIDGEPISLPTTYLGIEALLQRLEQDGIEAIMNGAEKAWGTADPDDTRQALKNS